VSDALLVVSGKVAAQALERAGFVAVTQNAFAGKQHDVRWAGISRPEANEFCIN